MAWAPDYVTLAAQKIYMRIDPADTVDDADLVVAITASSRAIDDHTNRQFGQINPAAPRVYTASWNARRCRWVVDIDDLQDIAGLLVQLAAGPVDVFTLEPVNAVLDGLAFTRLVIDPASINKPTGKANEFTITAKWGWTAFPVPVTQAARLQSSRFHSRRSSPYGIAGSPDQGSEMRLLSRVDPDVAVTLHKYRRARKVG